MCNNSFVHINACHIFTVYSIPSKKKIAEENSSFFKRWKFEIFTNYSKFITNVYIIYIILTILFHLWVGHLLQGAREGWQTAQKLLPHKHLCFGAWPGSKHSERGWELELSFQLPEAVVSPLREATSKFHKNSVKRHFYERQIYVNLSKWALHLYETLTRLQKASPYHSFIFALLIITIFLLLLLFLSLFPFYQWGKYVHLLVEVLEDNHGPFYIAKTHKTALVLTMTNNGVSITTRKSLLLL